MQKIRRKFCPSCLKLDKSVHLVTTSGRNVQWRVAVVVDYVGVRTGPQDHRQGVLQRCYRCQDSFLLLVDLAVARNCCVDRCVSLTIRDISCCPLSKEKYCRKAEWLKTLSRRNWTASIWAPSTALWRGVRPALSWVEVVSQKRVWENLFDEEYLNTIEY